MLAFRPLLAALLISLALVPPLACRRSDAVAAQALPQLGTVGPFWLTDQDGRSFSEQSLSGKVWVAAFMFTRCPSICPEMTRRMRSLQEQARARALPLHLVSFSVDPDNDTPPVLRQFAQQYGVDTSSWSFLTGDNRVIRNAAEQGFKIGVDGAARPGAEHLGITHGTHLVLLDGARRIRGYYQSSEPEQLKQLLEDAAALVSAGNS
jgi:protein SCO1